MRRSFMTILALVVAMFAGVPAFAQGIAVTPEGWQRTVAETGTVFYRCQAATCPTGSTVSYRQQRDGPLMPFADFQRFNVQTNQRMVEQSNGAVRSVEMIEIGQRTMAENQLYTAVKIIHRANGRDEFYVSTIFSDGRRHYSVVSSAASERDARANMDQFLPIVMLASQMR